MYQLKFRIKFWILLNWWFTIFWNPIINMEFVGYFIANSGYKMKWGSKYIVGWNNIKVNFEYGPIKTVGGREFMNQNLRNCRKTLFFFSYYTIDHFWWKMNRVCQQKITWAMVKFTLVCKILSKTPFQERWICLVKSNNEQNSL